MGTLVMKKKNSNKKLSEAQIKKIRCMYRDPSVTVREIIEELKLDVSYQYQLIRLIPPEVTDVCCRYCNEKMLHYFGARADEYREEQRVLICPKCGHRQNGEGTIYCNCDKCKEERNRIKEEERKKTEEKRKQEREALEEKIRLVYCDGISTVSFSELPYYEKSILVDFLLYSDSLGRSVIEGTNLDKSQSKHIDFLYDRGFISVSPSSPIWAFEQKDFPYSFNKLKVNYSLNVDFKGCEIEAIKNGDYDFDTDTQGKLDALRIYIAKAISSELRDQLYERGIELSCSGTELTQFYSLIYKISYLQIRYSIYKAAVYLGDLCLCGKVTPKAAGKMAIKNIYSYYERCKERNWNIYSARVDYSDENLIHFVTTYLKKDLKLLDLVPTVDNYESCPEYNPD